MLYITVRSSSATTVPKVLQVVEQAKRLRHKSGEDEELHQYVLYDTDTSPPVGANGKKAPKVINLNDDGNKVKGKYNPPSSLSVHLSKIPMPELAPKPKIDVSSQSKSKKKEQPEEEKPQAAKSKSFGRSSSLTRKTSKRHLRSPSDWTSNTLKKSSPPPPNNSTRPVSQNGLRTPAHQPHPRQPSPSPSQLNNPFIYTAPPPRGRSPPRPTQPTLHPHANSHPYPNAFYVPGAHASAPGMPPRPVSAQNGAPSAQSPEPHTSMTSVVTGLLDRFNIR